MSLIPFFKKPASSSLPNLLFHASYTTDMNADFAYGSATGTGSAASVSGGYLILAGAGAQVSYARGTTSPNMTLSQGAVRMKIRPSQNDPTTTQTYIDSQSGSNKNRIELHQNGTGSPFLSMTVNGSGATGYTRTLGDISGWVAGTTYEVELNYNWPNIWVFVNGTLLYSATDLTGLSFDTSLSGTIKIGNSITTQQFDLDDIQIFSAVQHTSNYTP